MRACSRSFASGTSSHNKNRQLIGEPRSKLRGESIALSLAPFFVLRGFF